MLIAPIIACTLASMSISGKMSKYQAGWNQAVQRRVSAITATLTSIKNVKFSSMSQVRQDQIHSLRQEEVKQSKKFRSMIAFMNVICQYSLEPCLLDCIINSLFSQHSRCGFTRRDLHNCRIR